LQLENEIAQAAAANLAARAIKLEQRLEDEILEAAVRNLQEPDVELRKQKMQQLGEMVKRDKRTVQAITGLLGASSSAAVSGPTNSPPHSSPLLLLNPHPQSHFFPYFTLFTMITHKTLCCVRHYASLSKSAETDARWRQG